MSLDGAVGVFGFDADPDDPDANRLLSGNGARDYTIWVAGLQVVRQLSGRRLAVGADVFHNTEDYEVSEPARDEDTGIVLSARLGETDGPGDWL